MVVVVVVELKRTGAVVADAPAAIDSNSAIDDNSTILIVGLYCLS